MKNLNKVNRLSVMLQSEMLKYNVKLQSILEEERELKERNRLEEIELENLSEEDIEEVLENITEIETKIEDLLGIEADKIELQELLDINTVVVDYNKTKLHSDLMNEIADELKEESDKTIEYLGKYLNETTNKVSFYTNKFAGENVSPDGYKLGDAYTSFYAAETNGYYYITATQVKEMGSMYEKMLNMTEMNIDLYEKMSALVQEVEK